MYMQFSERTAVCFIIVRLDRQYLQRAWKSADYVMSNVSERTSTCSSCRACTQGLRCTDCLWHGWGRAVLVQLAEDEGWAPGWVFDGRKNIYAPLEFRDKRRHRFIGQDEQRFEVRGPSNCLCLSAQLISQLCCAHNLAVIRIVPTSQSHVSA